MGNIEAKREVGIAHGFDLAMASWLVLDCQSALSSYLHTQLRHSLTLMDGAWKWSGNRDGCSTICRRHRIDDAGITNIQEY